MSRVVTTIACIATAGGAALLAACGLLTDLSGLSGGSTGNDDGGSATSDARVPNGDASSDGSRDAGASDGSARDAATPKPPCTKSEEGTPCTVASQCCSDNCYQNVCQGNDVGSPCSVDDKCESDSCYDNVCRARTNGSPCAFDSKCDSDNCYDNVCHGNTAGEPCRVNSKCKSNNCFDNVCQ